MLENGLKNIVDGLSSYDSGSSYENLIYTDIKLFTSFNYMFIRSIIFR